MAIQADDKLAVELPAKTWQALSVMLSHAVSPFNIGTTEEVTDAWKAGLAHAQQSFINAKAQVDPPE